MKRRVIGFLALVIVLVVAIIGYYLFIEGEEERLAPGSSDTDQSRRDRSRGGEDEPSDSCEGPNCCYCLYDPPEMDDEEYCPICQDLGTNELNYGSIARITVIEHLEKIYCDGTPNTCIGAFPKERIIPVDPNKCGRWYKELPFVVDPIGYTELTDDDSQPIIEWIELTCGTDHWEWDTLISTTEGSHIEQVLLTHNEEGDEIPYDGNPGDCSYPVFGSPQIESSCEPEAEIDEPVLVVSKTENCAGSPTLTVKIEIFTKPIGGLTCPYVEES
jgi:hypothetical protein